MDNIIVNAMKKFHDMTEQHPVIEVDGRKYQRDGYRPITEPTIEGLRTHTLAGIVDALNNDIQPECKAPLHIHIMGPTEVYLESACFGPFLNRHILIQAEAYTTNIRFGHRYTPEEFIIALNSQLEPTEDRNKLLLLCSSITKETAGTISDTGISQKMEVKSGIAMKQAVEVKNPFYLKPYRTFQELDQPESGFVFRVNSEAGIKCSLFEADGSKWKIEAINRIKAFFKDAGVNVPVIA